MCHCPLNNSEADLERTEDEVEKKGVVPGDERKASDDTEGGATEQGGAEVGDKTT